MPAHQNYTRNHFPGERLVGGLDDASYETLDPIGDETHDESFCAIPAPKFRASFNKSNHTNSNQNNPNNFLDNLPRNSKPEKDAGYVYLLCFKERFHHAKHYVGMVRSESVRKYGIQRAIRRRLRQHQAGYGAVLTAEVAAVGIVIRIGGWQKGGLELEKKLKHRSDKAAFCKFCRKKYLRDRAREYQAKKAAKKTYTKHTRPRKSKASYPPPTLTPTKPTLPRLSKLTGLPRSIAKLYQDQGLLSSDLMQHNLGKQETAMREKKRRHLCEICRFFDALWLSRVCESCHTRISQRKNSSA